MFPEMDVHFASFGQRFGATLIDGMLIMILYFSLTYFNILVWKNGYVFILYSLLTIIYKPWMEYKFGATLGKMALRIKVVGKNFQKVTLNEELRRVSFYLVPNILSFILTIRVYFNGELLTIHSFQEYNQLIISNNPALTWLNLIVVFLAVADVFTFFFNNQNRSLHDLYADTYVITLG